MRRLIPFTLLLLAPAWGQPAWKSFSIGAPTGKNTRTTMEGMEGQGVPFLRIVSRAYNVPEYLILGPAWMASERYSLTALVSAPEDFAPLMQKELADRFHLVARRDKSNLSAYVLRTIPGEAHKLKAGTEGGGNLSNGAITVTNIDLSRFVSRLADVLSCPVINDTGIDGRFDFALTWLPGNPVSLQNAVKDQLGLQLLEDKREIDTLVVDRAEKLPVSASQKE
jgi:uncharacterized protein (TIGR03435 family)